MDRTDVGVAVVDVVVVVVGVVVVVIVVMVVSLACCPSGLPFSPLPMSAVRSTETYSTRIKRYFMNIIRFVRTSANARARWTAQRAQKAPRKKDTSTSSARKSQNKMRLIKKNT